MSKFKCFNGKKSVRGEATTPCHAPGLCQEICEIYKNLPTDRKEELQHFSEYLRNKADKEKKEPRLRLCKAEKPKEEGKV